MIGSVIEHVWRHAHNFGDCLCVADLQTHLSYTDCLRHVEGFCQYLRSQGLRHGDRVVVLSEQRCEYLVTDLAVALSGGVFVPLENGAPENRVLEIVGHVNAKILISENEIHCPGAVKQLRLSDALRHSAAATGETKHSFPKPDDTAFILFTTGTTGDAKGVMLSHGCSVTAAGYDVAMTKMRKDNRILLPVPLNHVFATRRYHASLVNGSGVVLSAGVGWLDEIFAAIRKYRVTAMALVPSMARLMLRLAGTALSEFAGDIRYIQLSSARISPTDCRLLLDLLPKTRLCNIYGATESGLATTIEYTNESRDFDSVGKPVEGCDVFFVDENGERVSATEENPGLVAWSGPAAMQGYFDDPDLTARIMRDGAFHSSDLGYMDEKGALHLKGRSGDVVNVGGYKVSLPDIEETIGGMEGIAECACIPVPDANSGFAVKAYIVAEPGWEFDPVAIHTFLAARLERHKLPKCIEAIDGIPKTYNGKTLRNVLRKLHEEGEAVNGRESGAR